MIVVVSDTTPINYLVLIGQVDLLSQLFEKVIIPDAVLQELSAIRAPDLVKSWVANLPAWIEVRRCKHLDATIQLDAGETGAISLALELGASSVLMDERRGRYAAQSRGLAVIGTLTILELADERGLVRFEDAVQQLQQTNFHLGVLVMNEAIIRVQKRRQLKSQGSSLA